MVLRLVSREELAKTSWWRVLEPSEQRVALIETQGLHEDLARLGTARSGIGLHLKRMRALLEKKRKFVAYVKDQCNFSVATAYRYIEWSEKTEEKMTPSVLKAVIEMGLDIDPKMMDKVPPPKIANKGKLLEWVGKVEEKRKKERMVDVATIYMPEVLMKEAVNFVRSRYERLPNNAKTRRQWIIDLDGFLLALGGIDKEQTIQPVEVPEKFRVIRGRPKTKGA